jgi:predicted transcriptional regulator YdeE
MNIDTITLIGLSLGKPTTNENGQSNIDCGQLWQKFESEKYFDNIPNKKSNDILAVYHNYEGDFTQPFSYFIGCEVPADTPVPEGLTRLIIPGGKFQKFVAKGKMPDCIAAGWKDIWNSGIDRAYNADFEVYDKRSHDWDNAEVDIFISVK